MSFLYLLAVLITLSTAIGDINPYTSLVCGINDKKVEFGFRGKQDFQNIIKFLINFSGSGVKK
jgi:hypothetical protein